VAQRSLAGELKRLVANFVTLDSLRKLRGLKKAKTGGPSRQIHQECEVAVHIVLVTAEIPAVTSTMRVAVAIPVLSVMQTANQSGGADVQNHPEQCVTFPGGFTAQKVWEGPSLIGRTADKCPGRLAVNCPNGPPD
jgi:hypothetical protein